MRLKIRQHFHKPRPKFNLKKLEAKLEIKSDKNLDKKLDAKLDIKRHKISLT